ncbi:hypothetical protein N9850_08925 [Granulosicoccus sp.]|nr:hypothetical protein [Granulosicoccus sp.]MDB4223883.1 hypothetical protein [Granulosicoccus sp.]
MSSDSPKKQVVAIASLFLGIAALPLLAYLPFLEMLGVGYSESPARDIGPLRILVFWAYILPLLLYPLVYVFSVIRCAIFIKKDSFVIAMKACWIPYKTIGFAVAVVLLQAIFDLLVV